MFMKERLISFSQELGFDDIGFARVQPIEEQFNKFENWLSLGFNAGMDFFYRNNEKRRYPQLLLANARTVIVFAKKYPSNVVFNSKIKIAKYALQRDYHLVLSELLAEFSSFLNTNFNAQSCYFVDSGAVLEKQWAVLAGIGWQGKNSLIINKKLGSFFNIGIILTDLEIAPNSKIPNECYNCQECIKHCPSLALISPYILDANKCLAYHTIENKNGKPDNIVRAMNKTGFIFGCDICQDVCPYNKKTLSLEHNSDEFIKIDDLLNLSENEFKLIFSDSAIKRAKHKNFIENISIVCNLDD